MFWPNYMFFLFAFLQIHDWDGSNLIFDFDFQEKDVAADERQIIGKISA